MEVVSLIAMISLLCVFAERCAQRSREAVRHFLFSLFGAMYADSADMGSAHKVNILNEAYRNGSSNTGTPFDKIPGVGWPSAECRIETLEIYRAK
jgi:hypothetical protein